MRVHVCVCTSLWMFPLHLVSLSQDGASTSPKTQVASDDLRGGATGEEGGVVWGRGLGVATVSWGGGV